MSSSAAARPGYAAHPPPAAPVADIALSAPVAQPETAPTPVADLPPTTAAADEVTVRYWAAAKAAAGVASDVVHGSTVAEVVDAAVARRPGLRPVAAVATFLVDGAAATQARTVPAGSTVEVLPPFAGG